MALVSSETNTDVVLGGNDRLLNVQMGRKVMEVVSQKPGLIVALPLMEGTDGIGAKMDRSKGSYIALSTPPG